MEEARPEGEGRGSDEDEDVEPHRVVSLSSSGLIVQEGDDGRLLTCASSRRRVKLGLRFRRPGDDPLPVFK